MNPITKFAYYSFQVLLTPVIIYVALTDKEDYGKGYQKISDWCDRFK